MSPSLRYEITPDLENATIIMVREFNAPRSLVWECYTTADLLDRWYAPKPLTARTKHMDFREGGYWLFAMITPEGQEYWSRQDYQAIQPTESITLLDAFSDAEASIDPDLPRATVEMHFAPAEDGCVVTSVTRYPSKDDLQKVIDMGMEAGMASTLERLDELLATLTEKDAQ
ncbi:SRPBCC family protein [Pseudoroseicyclus sp. H15]